MKTSIGLCGATGKTPEITIGQVKTVDYTQKASVEITGTRENPILNFNIPKGKDGAKLIVREYFNGDIQILNNLNELPEDTNSDKYGKTVMSVNGIKQLLEKINDVLTKTNANTNAIGSLTNTVQNNKSDIETKLNNFKSDTDTRVQNINKSISDLEGIIETKLNEEITKQVKALQDENKKLNDMLFENSLKEIFEGSDNSISDTSNGVVRIETIKGQTYQNLFDTGLKVETDATNTFDGFLTNIDELKQGGQYTIIYDIKQNSVTNTRCTPYIVGADDSRIYESATINYNITKGTKKWFIKFDTNFKPKQFNFWVQGQENSVIIDNFILLEGDWTNKEVPAEITGIESVGEKEEGKISILSHNKNLWTWAEMWEQYGISDTDMTIQKTFATINKVNNEYTINTASSTWYQQGIFTKPIYLKTGQTISFCGEFKNISNIAIFNINSFFKDGGSTVSISTDKYQKLTTKRTADESGYYACRLWVPSNTTGYCKNLQVEKSLSISDYVETKEDKKEILISLDGGLKSLPNGVADTIEQREDGFYLVQRIGKVIFDGSRNEWVLQSINSNDIANFIINTPNHADNEVYCNKFIYDNNLISAVTHEGIFVNESSFFIRIDKSKADTVEKFKTWLQDNPVTVYYKLATTIETKLDIDRLNLETFKDLTYVTTENSIKPVLKGQATKDITTVIKNLQSKGAN